jgi:hypothetical protein
MKYVRWTLDTLQEPYKEVENVGVLGSFLFGRLVPVLHVPKHNASIANSRDIARYLHGKYMFEERAAFLKPAGAKAAELEDIIENLGWHAREWVYYNMFCEAGSMSTDLLLRTWGWRQSRIQAWQKVALRLLFPILRRSVQKDLGINAAAYRKAVVEIDRTFDILDAGLFADGRKYILNTPEKTYLDMYLACMGALAVLPPQYSGGRIEPASEVSLDELPPTARAELERWRKRPTGQLIMRLFAEERGLSPK